MLSPKMNIDVLDFWGVIVFCDGGSGLSFPLPGGLLSLSVGQMLCFIWMCLNNNINLYNFNSAFCFANLVNWQSLSE